MGGFVRPDDYGGALCDLGCSLGEWVFGLPEIIWLIGAEGRHVAVIVFEIRHAGIAFGYRHIWNTAYLFINAKVPRHGRFIKLAKLSSSGFL